MRVSKGFLVVLKATRQNGLYIFDGETNIGTTTLVKHSSDKTILWHKHMGYISDKRLPELSKRGLLYGDKMSSIDPCEYLLLKKRVKFPKAEHTTKGVMDYVHSDL